MLQKKLTKILYLIFSRNIQKEGDRYIPIVKKDYNLNILLIGTGGMSFPGLNYQEIEWSEKTEIDYISKSHVGIMPLENYKWELGK